MKKFYKLGKNVLFPICRSLTGNGVRKTLNIIKKELPNLKNFDLKLIDSTTIEVEIDHRNNINDLFEVLSSQNINIKSMRNKRNRLEELFINLLNKKRMMKINKNV